MKISLYIQSHGILSRKHNTLQYINEEEKRSVPIAQVSDIHAFGKVSIRSGAIGILSEKAIPVHFYNQYHSHISSLMPKSHTISGKVLVAQVQTHLDPMKRSQIANAIVNATKQNMLYLLRQYNKREKDLEAQIERISKITVPDGSIPAVMGAEANIWKTYYSAFSEICPTLPFVKRSFHPPENKMNSLISLSHTVLYNTALTMIEQTYLSSAISFLHDPLERRYSLSLDLSEHMKPIIAHKLIFALVNRNQITEKSFDTKNGIRLKNNAFKFFLERYQEQLNSVVQVGKNKKLTFRNQLKHEAHKLVKTVLGDKPFKPFIMM